MIKSLPNGWVEGFDPNYGRPYYFHKPTRRSSWTKPDPIEDDNDEASTASSFRRSQVSGSQQGSQQAISRFNDWLEVYSSDFGRSFFFNKVTRESTWTDPRVTKTAQIESKATLVKREETPAAFLSVWETVGEDRKQPLDRPSPTHVSQAFGGSPVTQNGSRFTGGATASPISANSFSTPSSVDLRNADFQRSSRRNDNNDLADELELYTRDLERQGRAVKQHAGVLDSRSAFEAETLNMETSDLTKTAQALLNSEKNKRGVKRALAEDCVLSTWGNEPPKVLDVKRAMQEVKSGIKYARQELKAQSAANAEAEKVDSEGGYYTILGVSTNADLDTLKKAYRKAMIKWHPDKVAAEERDKAMEKSNMFQNAFNCLSDPWERYLYDYFGLKRYLQNAKVIQCFKNYLLSGVELTKHPRKGYPRKRFLWISPDFEWIMTGRERILEPTAYEREEMKGVRIKDIHEITRGITTEVFERTGKPKRQSRYFSIVTNERTLDLEAESKERADFYVSRISLLVLDTQKNKKWLLRHFELKALKEAAEMAQKAQSGQMPRPQPPDEENQPDGPRKN
jgi:curved DNA-binding protein CbpA